MMDPKTNKIRKLETKQMLKVLTCTKMLTEKYAVRLASRKSRVD